MSDDWSLPPYRFTPEPEPAPEPGDIARLTGSWNDDESRAFAEAMEALNSLPDDAPSYEAVRGGDAFELVLGRIETGAGHRGQRARDRLA